MRSERCETCRFGESETRIAAVDGARYPRFTELRVIGCYRFPAKVDKGPRDWCGEWKPDADYLAEKVFSL